MQLIVFDLDGTLINSLEDLADSANHVLAQHSFPTHAVDAYRYFVGDGVRKLIERILPAEERKDWRIEQCKGPRTSCTKDVFKFCQKIA